MKPRPHENDHKLLRIAGMSAIAVMVLYIAVTILRAQLTQIPSASATESTPSATSAPTSVPTSTQVVVATSVPTNQATPNPAMQPAMQQTMQPTHQPTPPIAPTHSPSPVPTQPPLPSPTPNPTPKPSPPPTCEAVNNNPWCYNFSPGNYIYNPPLAFCVYFACTASFWLGHGYVNECHDGLYSLSGGIRGNCLHHGGEWRPLYSH